MLIPSPDPKDRPEPKSLVGEGMGLRSDASLFQGPATARREVTTARGPVVIRPVTPLDADAVATFVRRLSPTARFRRFHSPVHALSPRQLEGIVDVDHRGRETLLALRGRRVVGMSQFIETRDPEVVEVAIVVADRWQRMGLGRLLLDAAITAAGRCGHTTVTAYAQAENRAILQLIRSGSLPTRMETVGSIVEITIALPA